MAKKKLLFIDADNMSDIETHLDSRYEVLISPSSNDGFDLVRSAKPDLVVVNVEISPTNGWSVCTKLKRDDDLKAIPVIMTSSSSTVDKFDQHKKLKTRAEEYLMKPYTAQQLQSLISSLIGDSGGSDDESVIVEETQTPDENIVLLDESEAVQFAEISPPTIPAIRETITSLHEVSSPQTQQLPSIPVESETLLSLDVAPSEQHNETSTTAPLDVKEDGSLRLRVAELESELDGYRQTEYDHHQTLENLYTENSKKDREIGSLRDQIHEKDRLIQELRDSESRLTIEAIKARDERMRREASLKSATVKTDQASQSIAKLEKDAKTAHELATAKSIELENSIKQIESMTHALSESKSAHQKAQTEITTLKADVESIQTEADKVIGEKEAALAHALKQLEEIQSKGSSEQQAWKKLKSSSAESLSIIKEQLAELLETLEK